VNIDFNHTLAVKEQHSYSGRTCIVAIDITAGSVKPIATWEDMNLQRMTVAGQSDYKVTRNHMNLDSCTNSKNIYGQLLILNNSKPCWNSASLNGY